VSKERIMPLVAKKIDFNKEEKIPFLVKKIVFHEHPDLDCIGCYFLARTYSQIGFLGIEQAKIEFWPQGPPPDGRTAEEHEKEGTICFDVGEGRFDHHPHGKCLDKCATDLVAEFLGVSDDIKLSRILGYIRMHDLEGPSSISRRLRNQGLPEEIVRKVSLLEDSSLAALLTAIHKQKNSNRQILEEGYSQLMALYNQQIYFWTEVKEEFQKKAQVWQVSSGDKIYRIATIESNIHDVGSFSRTKEGGACNVCIHRESKSGYVYITGTIFSAQFLEIAKILRVLELKKRGMVDETFGPFSLTESRFNLCPVWYLPRNKEGEVFMIMNGGEKAKNVEPTVLPLKTIEGAVAWGLKEEVLSESCPRDCCLLEECGFYPYFLTRCQKIRGFL